MLLNLTFMYTGLCLLRSFLALNTIAFCCTNHDVISDRGKYKIVTIISFICQPCCFLDMIFKCTFM